MRVLGAVRLSRLSDASLSPETQQHQIETWASLYGHEVVGITTDTDVSGAVSPFGRPGLGPYLTEDRAGQWDILVTSKLDRANRDVRDFLALVEWCEAHGKMYASVAEAIDLSTPAGRMAATIIAVVAQFERERNGERRKDSALTLRKAGRWDGGMTPFGYKAVKNGNGWQLEPDPVTAPIVRRMVIDMIDGKSMSAIARWLNAEGVSPAQYGKTWRPSSVQAILKSRRLRGEISLNGKAIRDNDGEVLRFKPLISETEWVQLEAALKSNAKPHRSGKHSKGSLLLRVAYCPCGQPLYRTVIRNHAYYRCAKRCPLPGIPGDELESHVTESMLALFSDLPLMRKVPAPPSRNVDELAEVERTIADLDAELEAGELPARSYARAMANLEAKRDRLAAQPETGPAETWQLTGETVGEHWERVTDATERGAMLRKTGVRVTASRPDRIMHVDIQWGDLEETRKRLAAL